MLRCVVLCCVTAILMMQSWSVFLYPIVRDEVNLYMHCSVLYILSLSLSLPPSLSGSRQRLLLSRVRRLSCTCNVTYCPDIEHRTYCRYTQYPVDCVGGDKSVLPSQWRASYRTFRCQTLGCLLYILSMMVLT